MSVRSRMASGMALESLESRRLLAGNVTVAHDSGFNLIVEGDNKSNQIDVEWVDGQILFTGLAGTTVNGGPSAALSAVANSVQIRMGNGDDFVAWAQDSGPFELIGIEGPLFIDTGNGSDEVIVSRWRFFGGLS